MREPNGKHWTRACHYRLLDYAEATVVNQMTTAMAYQPRMIFFFCGKSGGGVGGWGGRRERE